MLKYALRWLAAILLATLSVSLVSQNAIHAFENYNKGVKLLKINEYDSAAYYFNDAIALKPDISRAHYNLAVVYYAKADYKRAISTIDNYLHVVKSDKAYYLKARSFHLLNEIDSAFFYYGKAIAAGNKLPQACFYKGTILYERGDYQEALEFFTESVILDNQKGLYYYNRALTYEKLQLYDNAIDNYLTALEFFQDDAEMLSNLGYCYFKNNNNRDAVKYLKNALELEPENVSALNNLGLVYLGMDNNNEAITYFADAIKLDAGNPILLNNRGVAYYKIGDFDNAMREFNSIINRFSTDKIAYYNRANVKEYLLNIAGACEDWAKALLYGVDENIVPLNLCK